MAEIGIIQNHEPLVSIRAKINEAIIKLNGFGDDVVGPAGPSAYEIAVANGFVGTEAEWIASLSADVDLPDLSLIFEGALL